MLPLHDDNPTRITPIVTIGLIVANIVFFLYQLSIGLDLSVVRYGLIPAELLRGVDHVYTGRALGLPPGLGVTNLNPAWATVFTSMFSHGDWLHILGNMWFLWLFGNNVEEAMGHAKYLAFYLFSGAVAIAAQLVASMMAAGTVPMVGASGAVAGVLGAYLILYPRSRVITLVPIVFIFTTMELPASVVLGFWFVMELVRSFWAFATQPAGGVAYAAHVGGFIVGLLLARVLGGAPHRPAYAPQAPPDAWDDWRR